MIKSLAFMAGIGIAYMALLVVLWILPGSDTSDYD